MSIDVLETLGGNSIDSVVTNSKLHSQFIDIWNEIYRVMKPGGYLLCITDCMKYHKVTMMIEDSGFEIRDQLQFFYMKNEMIRPMNDPICMGRKPFSESNTVDNIEKWGVGGINIDKSRIPTDDSLEGGAYSKNSNRSSLAGDKRDGKGKGMFKKGASPDYDYKQPSGRFPANILFDREAGKVLDKQSGVSISTGGSGELSMGALGDNVYGKYKNDKLASNAGGLGDEDGASRYFYCPEDEVDLYRYLIEMVTPDGGAVLDPFVGRGSIIEAVRELDVIYIGVKQQDTKNEKEVQKVNSYIEKNVVTEEINPQEKFFKF